MLAPSSRLCGHWPRQRLNHEPGGDRMDALQVLAHGPIDRLAVTDVGQIDDDLDEMLHRAAGLLDQLPYVPHDLVRLLHRIVAVDARAVLEALRTLAAQEDHAPARDDRLAEIVVEVLLRIGVRRVEFPDSLVSHWCFPSRPRAPVRRLCVLCVRAPARSSARRPPPPSGHENRDPEIGEPLYCNGLWDMSFSKKADRLWRRDSRSVICGRSTATN